MKKKVVLASALFLVFPLIASAQTVGALLQKVGLILNSLVPLAIGLAVVLFLFGVIKYVTSGDSEESRKSGRQMMLWGIIGLFVMVSVWGLVQVLTASSGVVQGGTGTAPMIPPIP